MLRLDRDSTYRQQALEDLQDNEPLFLARAGEPRRRSSRSGKRVDCSSAKRNAGPRRRKVWQHRLELEHAANLGLDVSTGSAPAGRGDMSGYASTCGELIDRYAQDEIGAASVPGRLGLHPRARRM